MRRAAFALVALALATLLTLLGLEVALRLGGSGEGGFRSDAVARKPGRSGRGPDEPPPPGPKVPGTYRIAVLGDSFTWGWRIHPEDSYPARLAQRLARARPDATYEVLNFGRPSWNSSQQRRHFERSVLELDPDLVILGYCLNDAEPENRGLRDRQRAPLNRRSPSAWLSRQLYQVSRVYRLVWTRLEHQRQRRAFDAYYAGLFDPGNPHWRQSLRAIEGIQERLQAAGKPFLVVVFPMFESHLGGAYRYRRHHEQLDRELGARGIRHLDLLPEYEGLDPHRLAVDPFLDPHPSEIAQRIAADRIVAYLGEQALLP